MRQRVAIVVGMPEFARSLATLINAHGTEWRLVPIDDYGRLGTLKAVAAAYSADAIISFGGPGPNAALVQLALRRSIPIVVIWAGTDVLNALEQPAALQSLRTDQFFHISVSPWLKDELRTIGIDAPYVPVSAVNAEPPVSLLPAAFRVLTYLPEPRREFYGAETVYDAARAMGDVEFWVLGKGRRDPAAPLNVLFFGKVPDSTPYIDGCSALLRMPKHDGLSNFVLEALSRGRHVIWNHDLPHVTSAETPEDAIEKLQTLRRKHDAGELALNTAGRDYVLEHFGQAEVAAGFEELLNDAYARVFRPSGPAKYRVAISGLSLFCAEVAALTRAHVPDWEACILNTESRLEVLASAYALLRSDVWYSVGEPAGDRMLSTICRLMRKPHVFHWVGSDILHLKDPECRKQLQSGRLAHLAEVEWTQQELRQYGIEASIAPLPPRLEAADIPPLPDCFTVLFYLPRNRSDWYGARIAKRLMEALRGEPVRYIIVGGGAVATPPGIAAENIGWRQDLRPIYDQATVLVRFTPRDGLSLMVLEALAMGRHVIWTHEFPHVMNVRTYPEIATRIHGLLKAHKAGTLTPNAEGSAYVKAHYAPRNCIAHIASQWEAARGRRHPAASAELERARVGEMTNRTAK